MSALGQQGVCLGSAVGRHSLPEADPERTQKSLSVMLCLLGAVNGFNYRSILKQSNSHLQITTAFLYFISIKYFLSLTWSEQQLSVGS